MKTFRFIGALLVMALYPSLTAYSNGGNNYNAEDIIGIWEFTYTQSRMISNNDGKKVYMGEADNGLFYEFKANGKGHIYWRESDKDNITWELKGNQFKIVNLDEDNHTIVYTIRILTDTTLIIFYCESGVYYKSESTSTFTRVVKE